MPIIWRKEKRVFFWTLIFFSGIVFSLKNPIAQFFYSLNLPVLGSSTPTRILFLTSFSGSILGALGLDSILEEIKKEKFLAKILVVAFILAFIYLLGWIWAIFFKETIALRNLVIPTLLFVFGLFVLLVRRKELLILILLITILDLFYYGTKITPFVSKNLVFPENEVFSFLKERGGIDRFFGFSGAYVDTNFATYYKVFNPEGYDPLFIGRYGELVSAGKNGRIKDKIPRSDVNFENVYPADSFAENRFRRRLFSLLGVKYIITKKEPLTEDLFNLISHGKNFDFYEYKEALPRFFLTGDYIVMKEPQQIIDNIMDKTFPLENTIILEEELPKEFTLPRKSSGKVRLISYRENEVLFEIEAFDNQLFFLSDNFYQGWVATINGERAKIYRANYTFRAVAVSQGKHELLFTYQPWSLLQKDIQQSL